MSARRGTLAVLAGAAVGAAAGFVAERRLVHPRLAPPAGALLPSPPPAERRTVVGPRGLPIAVERTAAASDAPDPPAPPVVVLVHGWLCTTRVWDAVVPALADVAHVVAYDQPGHGRTPSPPGGYDLDLLGDGLLAVVEAEAERAPVVLVGHSLGGMTVMNALRRHRERLTPRVVGVALVSTTSSARRDPAEGRRLEAGIRSFALLQRLLRPIALRLSHPRALDATARLTGVTSDLATLVTRAAGLGPAADAATAAAVTRMVLGAGPEPALGLVDAVLGVDEDAALELLPPTVAVVGAVDRLTPPVLTRRMAARARGRFRVVELPRVGHLPPMEAPGAVVAAIVGLLADAGPRAGAIADAAGDDRPRASA